MRPLIDVFQRIFATVLVASLYLLPATLGGLAAQLDADLDTQATPERAATFIMSLPAAADIPTLRDEAEEEPEEPKESSQRSLAKDSLSSPGGTPITSTETEATTASKKTGKKRGKGSGKRRGTKCMTSTGQVSQLDKNHYQIERSLLDHYFGDTDEADKLGSAAWYRDEDGDIEGIRVRRVRCGSPVEEAGLRQGDIIRAANGTRVDSIAGVISLWWQLRRKDTVRLSITRDGSRKRLRYSLV